MRKGSAFTIASMKRMSNNRALLKKKAPFQILKENGFVKSKVKKYVFSKMTSIQRTEVLRKVADIKWIEKRNLILALVLTAVITILLFTMIMS